MSFREKVYNTSNEALTVLLLGVAVATVFIALFGHPLLKAAVLLYEILP